MFKRTLINDSFVAMPNMILNDDGYIMLNDTRISLLSERPFGQQPCGGGEDGRF